MYVAVKGGERAIDNAHLLLAKKRRGDTSIPELSVEQVREQMPLAVARVMSENPARIAGLADQGCPLEVGEPANLVVVDPAAHWTVDGTALASRSANTPYQAMTLPATVTATLLRGRVTARDGKACPA